MKQPIAGVVPTEFREATIMTVWPTLAAWPIGRTLGSLYSIRVGIGNVLTIGNLIAALSIPLAIGLFFLSLAPGICRRYTLTNRRVIVRKGLTAVDERWVSLDNFDQIDVQILPGQQWFRAGEMIFRKGKLETFRLSGVSRPETFRQTCLKAQLAHTQVAKVRELQAAHA
jgi:hypothetical protein